MFRYAAPGARSLPRSLPLQPPGAGLGTSCPFLALKALLTQNERILVLFCCTPQQAQNTLGVEEVRSRPPASFPSRAGFLHQTLETRRA